MYIKIMGMIICSVVNSNFLIIINTNSITMIILKMIEIINTLENKNLFFDWTVIFPKKNKHEQKIVKKTMISDIPNM